MSYGTSRLFEIYCQTNSKQDEGTKDSLFLQIAHTYLPANFFARGCAVRRSHPQGPAGARSRGRRAPADHGGGAGGDAEVCCVVQLPFVGHDGVRPSSAAPRGAVPVSSFGFGWAGEEDTGKVKVLEESKQAAFKVDNTANFWGGELSKCPSHVIHSAVIKWSFVVTILSKPCAVRVYTYRSPWSCAASRGGSGSEHVLNCCLKLEREDLDDTSTQSSPEKQSTFVCGSSAAPTLCEWGSVVQRVDVHVRRSKRPAGAKPQTTRRVKQVSSSQSHSKLHATAGITCRGRPQHASFSTQTRPHARTKQLFHLVLESGAMDKAVLDSTAPRGAATKALAKRLPTIRAMAAFCREREQLKRIAVVGEGESRS